MTYRQAIQGMVETLDKVHTDTGWLRDQSTPDEQITFNNTRRMLMNVIVELNKLDNRLSDRRAQTDLGIDKL